MQRKYGSVGLEANRKRLAHIGLERRDDWLLQQYLAIVKDDDPLQAAYIARAMTGNGWTFAEFVRRLIVKWAAENAR